jgi:hypothetical protein
VTTKTEAIDLCNDVSIYLYFYFTEA